MNESEMNSPASAELSDQIAALRCQVFTLLLALVVISGTLTVFLFYQSRISGEDIVSIEPQAMQMIQTSQKNLPGIQAFVNQLIAYGQTHPEFQQQVLNKYNIKPGITK